MRGIAVIVAFCCGLWLFWFCAFTLLREPEPAQAKPKPERLVRLLREAVVLAEQMREPAEARQPLEEAPAEPAASAPPETFKGPSPVRYDKRTPLEKVADSCDLDRQRLEELAKLDPEVAVAILRTSSLFAICGDFIHGYFDRECVRRRDGIPSVPLSEELRAFLNPLPDDIYLAAEKADACVQPHVLAQDLTAESFIWVEGRGGCMEELALILHAMGKAEMDAALEKHTDQ